MVKKNRRLFIIFSSLLLLAAFFSGCSSGAVSAQEYYSIGMAYFDLGKYDEAEKWLNRARLSDRTMVASTYHLGRLAFERQRYEEASKHFESILKKDADNILALKAAAYSRIKANDIEIAEKHYNRLLSLVPDSADDGYNHALVLYTLKRYTAAEEVLKKFPVSLQENRDTMLLYARCQAAQKKIEAIDRFADWLASGSDAKVRYEYAEVLEYHEFYAKALEEYRLAHANLSESSTDPRKSAVRFAIARTLLTADGESAEGTTELQGAVTGGFDDIPAVEELLKIKGINASNRSAVQNIISAMRVSASAKAKQEETGAASADEEEDLEANP